MKLIRKNKKRVIFEKIDYYALISVPSLRIEKFLYISPYKIGKSNNNDLVINEDGFDKFNLIILNQNKNIFVINVSKRNPVYINNSYMESFMPYQIYNNIEIMISNKKLLLMPRNEYIKRKKINYKYIDIDCPFCTSKINIENKFCELCSFGSKEQTRLKFYRYRNFYEIVDYKDSYYKESIKDYYEKENEDFDYNDRVLKTRVAILKILNSKISGRVYEIVDEETTIGRSKYNSISLYEANDLTMSRFHAKIIKKIDGYYIEDNESLNGTYVNGKKIIKRKLENNDIILIGSTEILFKIKGQKD